MAINVSTADLDKNYRVGEVKANQILAIRGEDPKETITQSRLEMILGVNWRDLEVKML